MGSVGATATERVLLYTEDDIGRPKAHAAAAAIGGRILLEDERRV